MDSPDSALQTASQSVSVVFTQLKAESPYALQCAINTQLKMLITAINVIEKVNCFTVLVCAGTEVLVCQLWVVIFTSVRSVTLGLPWRSLWLQVWAHPWCNRGWIMPTLLCTECQHLTGTNYSLSKILLLVWFCLLFAIFKKVSDSVTFTGFPFTTEYSSKSLHLPIRP